MHIDLIIQIKNAQAAGLESIRVSCAKFDLAVLELLVRTKHIVGFARKGRGTSKLVEIRLRNKNEHEAIRGIKIVSKPSRRVYVGYDEIRAVKRGFGAAALSTSAGVMTGAEARKKKVGGEFLFEIW